MTLRRNALITAVGASVAMTPVVASAQTAASSLSVVQASRAGAEMEEASQQIGGFPWLVVFVVVAVGLGIYFAVDEGEDGPTSP